MDWLTVTANPTQIYQENDQNRYIDAFYKVDWSERAEILLDKIAEVLHFGNTYISIRDRKSDIKVFPKLSKKGYTVERQYKTITIGYHPILEYMGICLEFTGEALKDYRKMIKGYDIEMAESFILRSVAEVADSFESAQPGIMFSSKCTRIDIAIDEFNGEYSVEDFIDEYYRKRGRIDSEQVNNGEVIMKAMKVSRQIIQTTNGDSSLYIGSINSAKRFNIYNKVAERKSAGENVDETNWVRFEGRFKKEYALQIANQLMLYADEFRSLKYCYAVIVSNFCFKLPDGQKHELVAEWKQRSKGVLGVLHSEDRRKSTFETSYVHLTERAGLFSLMKKAELLYGYDAVTSLLTSLMNDYKNYKVTDDVNKFVNDHEGEDWADVFPNGWKVEMEKLQSEQSSQKRG